MKGTCTEYFFTIELWVTTFGPNNQENSSDESVFSQKHPAAFPPILALQRKKMLPKRAKSISVQNSQIFSVFSLSHQLIANIKLKCSKGSRILVKKMCVGTLTVSWNLNIQNSMKNFLFLCIILLRLRDSMTQNTS